MELQKIDLGLSSNTKWASCNLEAAKEKNGGIYFDDNDLTFFKPYKHLEGDWSLPTIEQWRELKNECRWDFSAKEGGFRITGKNGNSIFLPLAGYRDCWNREEGCFGYYWAAEQINLSSDVHARYYVWFDTNAERWGLTHNAFMRQTVRFPMRFVSK